MQVRCFKNSKRSNVRNIRTKRRLNFYTADAGGSAKGIGDKGRFFGWIYSSI